MTATNDDPRYTYNAFSQLSRLIFLEPLLAAREKAREDALVEDILKKLEVANG